MATVGHITVTIDTKSLEAIEATFQALEARLQRFEQRQSSPTTAASIVATVALAAGVSQPISRRALLGLWRRATVGT